jgi:hypothetical protein
MIRYDGVEIRWHRLDGNHGYCATKCANCGSGREIYVRDPDDMHWCQDCDANWMPDGADTEPLTPKERP